MSEIPRGRLTRGRHYRHPHRRPVPADPPLPFQLRQPRPRPGHGTVWLFLNPAQGTAQAVWEDEKGIENVRGHVAPVQQWARSRQAQFRLVCDPEVSDWVDLDPQSDNRAIR